MADLFKASGDISTETVAGLTSGVPQVVAHISESVYLVNKAVGHYELSADAPVNVGFGGLTAAHVVMVKTTGGKVRVRYTSSDGATQAVPVDDFMLLITESVGVTALDLTRVAGTSTTVDVFLGQKT